ncbi:MAG: histidinol-phosphate transaminase [Actinomycetota bacterium]
MTDPDYLSVRSDLIDVEPYESPQRPAPHRMNTNESPYPPPVEVVAEVTQAMEATAWNRYPDKDSSGLLDALTEHTGWRSDGIWVANGSNEVLLQLFLAFGGPGRTSLTFEPTYSLHSLIPRIAATDTVSAPRGSDLEIEADAIAGVLERFSPDIVLLCSPNNPTGSTGDRENVTALCDAVPLVVVDEAYIEFAGEGASAQELLDQHDNLVITRTFSKAWSLAGARLGYLLAQPWAIDALRKVRLPYNISSFAQLFGVAALRHRAVTDRTVARIVEERQRLIQGLQAMGVHAFRSEANFVLYEIERARHTWQALLDRGVLVRDYSDNPAIRYRTQGEDVGCLRVTAGLPEETDAFLDAMEEVHGAVATI